MTYLNRVYSFWEAEEQQGLIILRKVMQLLILLQPSAECLRT
jgi:hypothetical protein